MSYSFINIIMQILTISKLLFFKLQGIEVELFSGVIFWGFPKIRGGSNIKFGKDFHLGRYPGLQ